MSRLFISVVRFFGPNKQLFESHEELSMYVLINGLRKPLAGKHEDVTFQCIIRCCAIVLVISKKIMHRLRPCLHGLGDPGLVG